MAKSLKVIHEVIGMTGKIFYPEGKLSVFESFAKAEVENKKKLGEDIGEEHPFSYDLYENAYTKVPIVQGAIDKTVDFVVGPGFHIKTDDEKVKKTVEDFMHEQNFDMFLRQVVRDMLVYGSEFVEIIGKGEKIEKLNILDPKYIYVQRDNKGKVLGYTQWTGKGRPIKFSIDEIAHFPYNMMGDDAYGTSILRPLFGGETSVLESLMIADRTIKNILNRRANPPWHIKVGTDEYPATVTALSNIAANLVYIRDKNEFVTDHTVEIQPIMHRGRTIDWDVTLNHILNELVAGLQVPMVLLGKADVNGDIAQVQMEAFQRRITSIQSFIENKIEKEIFSRIVTDKEVEFVWSPSTEEDEDNILLRLMNIIKTQGLSLNTRQDVENMLRKQLGLEEIDDFEYPMPTKPFSGPGDMSAPPEQEVPTNEEKPSKELNKTKAKVNIPKKVDKHVVKK